MTKMLHDDPAEGRALNITAVIGSITVLLGVAVIAATFYFVTYDEKTISAPSKSVLNPLPEGFRFKSEKTFEEAGNSITFQYRVVVVEGSKVANNSEALTRHLTEINGWQKKAGGLCRGESACVDVASATGVDVESLPPGAHEWIEKKANENDAVVVISSAA